MKTIAGHPDRSHGSALKFRRSTVFGSSQNCHRNADLSIAKGKGKGKRKDPRLRFHGFGWNTVPSAFAGKIDFRPASSFGLAGNLRSLFSASPPCFTPATGDTPMRRRIIDWPVQRCAIPLDSAWFCESCRAIGNDLTCCLCDNSEHTQRLAPWLDREPEPISVPLTGVFLTVIPSSRKLPEKAKCSPLPQRAPRAS